MARLNIKNAPLLTNILGTEKIPTGTRGDYTITPDLLATYFTAKLPFATKQELSQVKANLEDQISTVQTTLSESISALNQRVGAVETEMVGFTQDLTLHKADQSNPHNVTKQQVGLGSVDNTSDVNKPLSNANKAYVDAVSNNLKLGLPVSYSDSVNTLFGGYVNGSTILLNDGVTEVVSTIDNNTANPNTDMTGWVLKSTMFIVTSINDLPTKARDTSVAITKGYHPAKNFALYSPYKGGAKYVYSEENKNVNDGFTCIRGWLLQVENGSVTPELAGAKSDGVSNDTSAVQKVLSSDYTSVEIASSYIVSEVVADKPKLIFGGGSLSKPVESSGYAMLKITSSDVTVSNVAFLGEYANATRVSVAGSGCSCILAVGESSLNPISNVTIENCSIKGGKGFAIFAKYIQNINVTSNRIRVCGYSGATLLSCIKGSVVGNHISDIDSDSGAVNYYGISLTRDALKTHAESLRSQSIIVSNNTVENVVKWAGIDMHAPTDCIISNNTVRNCRDGIYCQYDSSTSTTNQFSENITIANNIVYGNSQATNSMYGIASIGLATLPNKNITVVGNQLFNCGRYGSVGVGALHVSNTIGGTVSHNFCSASIRCALSIMGVCQQVTFVDNIVDGVKDGGTASSRSYIFISATTDTQSCKFSNNKMYNTLGTDYTPTIGIFYTGATTGVVFSKNRMPTMANQLRNTSSGVSNRYDELNFELETEVVSIASYKTVGGTPIESLGSQSSLFRRLPVTVSGAVFRSSAMLNQRVSANTEYDVRGSYGGIYTPAIIKTDGKNVVAGITFTDIVLSVTGVYWSD